jgi:hypothetical protein
MRYILTQAEFLQKAAAVHGNRYDYSEALYVRSNKKVKIICLCHGVFEQTANSHLSGFGCKKCVLSHPYNHTSEAFVAKAQAVHGIGTYDYSQVEYVSNSSKVTIICPKHGPFNQKASGHTSGKHGCPKCSRIRFAKMLTLSTSQFIAKAQVVHGKRYDYSQVEYISNISKVTIICPKHGPFKQKPTTHVSGHGCQKCASELKARQGHLGWINHAAGRLCTLYLLKVFNLNEQFYKIGITSRSVSSRYKGNCIAGYSYEVLATYVSDNALAVFEWEQSILETFAHLQYWPKRYFGGATECFSSADEILAIFPL